MKWNVIFPAVALLLLASCTNKQRSSAEMPDGPYCFTYIMSLDTISLNINVTGSEFSGSMRYGFYEKDQSNGTITGKIKGNRLIGEYDFTAEGMESVSEIIFEKRGDELYVGFGEMEDKEGKMVYIDPDKLNFETFVLKKADCK